MSRRFVILAALLLFVKQSAAQTSLPFPSDTSSTPSGALFSAGSVNKHPLDAMQGGVAMVLQRLWGGVYIALNSSGTDVVVDKKDFDWENIIFPASRFGSAALGVNLTTPTKHTKLAIIGEAGAQRTRFRRDSLEFPIGFMHALVGVRFVTDQVKPNSDDILVRFTLDITARTAATMGDDDRSSLRNFFQNPAMTPQFAAAGVRTRIENKFGALEFACQYFGGYSHGDYFGGNIQGAPGKGFKCVWGPSLSSLVH